jgi:hypothetical protein
MATQYKRADFSKKAISRAVLRQTTQHPSVLYPAGAAIIGGLAAIALGPSLATLGALAAGGAMAFGGLAINQWLRRDYFANKYVTALREKLLSQHAQAMKALEKGLTEIDNKPGQAQLRRVREKFESFKAVLNDKLDPNELTHSRYLGIAEQVYFAVLDNLSRIVSVSRSGGAIDVDYTRQRLQELSDIQQPGHAEQQEITTLEQRLALSEQQQARVKEWLAANELAMTQLDTTAMTLASTETTQGLAKVDLETAMSELQRLASTTALYDRDNLEQ